MHSISHWPSCSCSPQSRLFQVACRLTDVSPVVSQPLIHPISQNASCTPFDFIIFCFVTEFMLSHTILPKINTHLCRSHLFPSCVIRRHCRWLSCFTIISILEYSICCAVRVVQTTKILINKMQLHSREVIVFPSICVCFHFPCSQFRDSEIRHCANNGAKQINLMIQLRKIN